MRGGAKREIGKRRRERETDRDGEHERGGSVLSHGRRRAPAV